MKTVLLIDDDEAFTSLVKDAFGKRSYAVVSASDGKAGLEAVKGSKPDIILLDLKMPGMDGISFLRALKDTSARHIPIIIVTNDTSLDAIADGTELGVRTYILKANESMQTILDKVEKLLKE